MPRKATDAVRVNIRVSSKVKDYYENMAQETGTTMSACMSLVLKMYMDGLDAAKSSKDIMKMLENLRAEGGEG